MSLDFGSTFTLVSAPAVNRCLPCSACFISEVMELKRNRERLF